MWPRDRNMSNTNETDEQRGWTWLDAVAVALMLTGISLMAAFLLWGEHPDTTLPADEEGPCDQQPMNTMKLLIPMGFVAATAGLRLLVRRRFRRNAQASMEYSIGIRLMSVGVWPFTAGLVLLPLFADNEWLTMLLLLLLVAVGYLLVAGGYIIAFVVSTMTVFELDLGHTQAGTRASARPPAHMNVFVAPISSTSGQPRVVEDLGPSIDAMKTNSAASD